MSLLTYYRQSYEYERDCNEKMLSMLESVPEANRTDPRFQRAVTLADHLLVGREKWLDYMASDGKNEIPWWNETCELATLRPRFAEIESRWTEYLEELDDTSVAGNFSFPISDTEQFTIPIEVQIVQLIGHAPYHRGQVALLVDMLGGEVVDTDYADWMWEKYMAVQ